MLSRRHFVHRVGLVALGAGPLASSVGCHVRVVADHPAYARAVILGDSALCVGCRRCELICSASRYPGRVWPEMARVGVDGRAEERRWLDGQWFADACHECPGTIGARGEEVPPPCVAACAPGALRVADPEEGEAGRLRLRVIDEARCDGCGDCVTACPTASPRIDPVGDVAVLCDLCCDRAEGPACVAACPSSALRYYEPWRHLPERPLPWAGGRDGGS
jgi:Fe-S-cluster-containing hydrogenase component 2